MRYINLRWRWHWHRHWHWHCMHLSDAVFFLWCDCGHAVVQSCPALPGTCQTVPSSCDRASTTASRFVSATAPQRWRTPSLLCWEPRPDEVFRQVRNAWRQEIPRGTRNFRWSLQRGQLSYRNLNTMPQRLNNSFIHNVRIQSSTGRAYLLISVSDSDSDSGLLHL